jgi:hypothetical protein
VKLEGSLDAFSLPDVFQLLSLTKKSGGLHLTNGQVSGVVYFAGGAVTGASSDASRQALARRLVGLGAADDAALRRAVERAAADGAGVTRALVEAGAVDPSVVQRLALQQVVDAVFDLLRWPNGDFSFAMDEENPDEVGLSVPADQIVNEAAARRESWESLSRLIPSPEVVLTMPVVVPEGTTVAPDEWALLSLVDGVRPVGELVDVSGAGQFAVVSTLGALLQRGLLAIRDEESPDHIALVRRRQQLLAPLEGGAVAAPTATPSPDPAPIPPVTVGVPASGAVTAPAAPPLAPTAEPLAPAASADPGVLPGAHDPASVVPPRPEPFLPRREVDHPEPSRAPSFGAPAAGGAPVSPPLTAPTSGATGTVGTATAAQPVAESAIERDPTVNRSLMLRLIAGVRGL